MSLRELLELRNKVIFETAQVSFCGLPVEKYLFMWLSSEKKSSGQNQLLQEKAKLVETLN